MMESSLRKLMWYEYYSQHKGEIMTPVSQDSSVPPIDTYVFLLPCIQSFCIPSCSYEVASTL